MPLVAMATGATRSVLKSRTWKLLNAICSSLFVGLGCLWFKEVSYPLF